MLYAKVAKDDGRLRLDASPAQASCDGFRLLYVLLCFRYVVSIQYLTVILAVGTFS